MRGRLQAVRHSRVAHQGGGSRGTSGLAAGVAPLLDTLQSAPSHATLCIGPLWPLRAADSCQTTRGRKQVHRGRMEAGAFWQVWLLRLSPSSLLEALLFSFPGNPARWAGGWVGGQSRYQLCSAETESQTDEGSHRVDLGSPRQP